MDEYISGDVVAKAIGDDRELFNSYILDELTPYHLKLPQTFERSCLPCAHAMDNGQPDPYRCNTDPCSETYTDVVDGYSRHSACGYGWLDDEEIIRRLKRSSFRKNEIETFMRDMGLVPVQLLDACAIHFATAPELVEYHRGRGVHELHELARLVDEEFTDTARLVDEALGRLLPANPGAEISDEGHKRQGHRLRKKYQQIAS